VFEYFPPSPMDSKTGGCVAPEPCAAQKARASASSLAIAELEHKRRASAGKSEIVAYWAARAASVAR
jgi:hypothetical protein